MQSQHQHHERLTPLVLLRRFHLQAIIRVIYPHVAHYQARVNNDRANKLCTLLSRPAAAPALSSTSNPASTKHQLCRRSGLGPWPAGALGVCAPVQALLQAAGVARHGRLAATLAVAMPAVAGPGVRDYALTHQRAAHQRQALALVLANV